MPVNAWSRMMKSGSGPARHDMTDRGENDLMEIDKT
jgi:hypothetical protein